MWKAILTGLLLGLWLAISVGPILFTVIKQSLSSGIRGGLSFVAGIWLSDILFVFVSNVFTVFTTHFADTYIKQIGYGGAVLLFVLGCYFVFFKKDNVQNVTAGQLHKISCREMAGLFGAGFLINTLNPILFFEWLSAATVFAKSYTVNYRILIFAVCLSVNMLSDLLKVLLAGKIRPKLTARNFQVINVVTGCALIVCGCFLFYQTIYHSDKWKSTEEKAGVQGGGLTGQVMNLPRFVSHEPLSLLSIENTQLYFLQRSAILRALLFCVPCTKAVPPAGKM